MQPVRSISCPYCGQTVELLVDPSIQFQEYVEDCEVCCRPITLTVTVEESGESVSARREDD